MSKIYMAALAAALLSSAADATTPVLSGNYTVSYRRMCQPTLNVDFNGSGLVDATNLSSSSDSQQTILSADFNPKKGKVKITGFQDAGTVFLLQTTGSQNTNQGDPLNEQAQSDTNSYSNTDTTFTVGGEAYNAIYGQIDKKGVAHTVIFLGVTNHDGAACSEQGEITLQ